MLSKEYKYHLVNSFLKWNLVGPILLHITKHLGDKGLELKGLMRCLEKRKITYRLEIALDFLGSSIGKVSACNAEDPGSIPGSGRSPREG